MTTDDLRALPGFMDAWPGVRNILIEFLMRRQLAMAAANSPETGSQAMAKLISELEKLDSEPKPLVRGRNLKPLHSMTPRP